MKQTANKPLNELKLEIKSTPFEKPKLLSAIPEKHLKVQVMPQ